MPSIPSAFQDDVQLNMSGPTFVGQQTGIVGPTWSQWFSLTSPVPGKYVLAAAVEFTSYLTAATTGTPMTTLVNTNFTEDTLDEMISQMQIGPAPNAGARSELNIRPSCEEAERIVFNLPYTYPRAASASFATGTASHTAQLMVGIGGPAAAMRFYVPAITGAYATGVTASVTIVVRAVIGTVSTVITLEDKKTGTLAIGKNDLSPYFPTDIAPDYLSCVGDSTSTISAFFVTGANGSVLVDVDSAGGLINLGVGVAPFTNATTTAAKYPVVAFGLQKLRFRTITCNLSTAEAMELLWISFDGGDTTGATRSSAATPSPAASARVGYPLAGSGPGGPSAVTPANTGGGSIGVSGGSSGRIIRRSK